MNNGIEIITKEIMIERIASKLSLGKNTVDQIITSLIDEIELELIKKNDVKLIGLGTFRSRNRRSYTITNYKTNNPIDVNDQNSVIFTICNKLKSVLNTNA